MTRYSVVVASVAVTLFWGGWLRPFPNVAWLEWPLNAGVPFLALAGSGFASIGLMSIGWKYMIPIGMGAILVNAVVGMLKG